MCKRYGTAVADAAVDDVEEVDICAICYDEKIEPMVRTVQEYEPECGALAPSGCCGTGHGPRRAGVGGQGLEGFEFSVEVEWQRTAAVLIASSC